MEKTALYSISSGVFLLGTRSGDGSKINGCITNTCFQTASNPTRLAVSVIKQNLTCRMIQESGVFALSVLDDSCSFGTISRFGYQSGRDADKFSGAEYALGANGCPYILSETCAVLECRVLNEINLESHVLFVAEVCDAVATGKNAPLTYARYQAEVKPKRECKAESEKTIVGWRCRICGYEFKMPELPPGFECPICSHTAEDFEPIYG